MQAAEKQLQTSAHPKPWSTPTPPPSSRQASTAKFFIGGNWKCNGTHASVEKLVADLNAGDVPGDVDIVVAPPFIYIDYVRRAPVNCAWALRGGLRPVGSAGGQQHGSAAAAGAAAAAPACIPQQPRCAPRRLLFASACCAAAAWSPTPTAPLLPQVRANIMSSFQVAAQNCWMKPDGAFTGEISAEMLKDAGVPWVITGHSERRLLLGESNRTVGLKARPGGRLGGCASWGLCWDPRRGARGAAGAPKSVRGLRA